MRYFILLLLAGVLFGCGGSTEDGSEKNKKIKTTDGSKTLDDYVLTPEKIKADSTLLTKIDTTKSWKKQPYEGILWKVAEIKLGAANAQSQIDTTLLASFSNGKVSGFSGCNNFFGAYKVIDASSIKVLNVGGTKKMCQGNAMGQERRFLAILRDATAVKHERSQLTISSDKGSISFIPAN